MSATRTRGELVLEMDRIWCDPAASAAIIAEQRSDAGPDLDQFRAAVRDLDVGVQRLGGGPLRHQAQANPADLPGWLRLGALDAYLGWLDGTARTCLHNPNAARPAPFCATAWRPGLLMCGNPQCSVLAAMPHGSAQDRRCDGCGHVCGPKEGITPSLLTVGPLLYAYGVCADCFADMPWGAMAS